MSAKVRHEAAPRPPVVVQTDHLAYLTDRRYRRATHAELRRTARRRRSGMWQVLHESDGSCCALEDWSTTAGRIRAALASDGERALWVVLGAGGAA